MLSADDINGLLLLYSCLGNDKVQLNLNIQSHPQGLEKLAKVATEKGKNNVAFLCYFLLKRIDDCIKLLCDTGRVPEAAFLARTYLPRYLYSYCSVSHV